MAEIEKKHYNLRSGIDTAKLPAHIHISNDSEFLHKVLQNDYDSDSGDSSDSDLNCSAVVENSDSEQVDIQSTSSTSRSTSDTHTSLSYVVVQQVINVHILSQLSSISDRLQVWRKITLRNTRIRQKCRELPKRKPVRRLPRSQCHQHSLNCRIYIKSDKMHTFKVRWTRDSEILLTMTTQVQKLNL